MVAQLPGVVPDGFVYLHASPETCARRMASRGRLEEGGVSLDYLANLHGKHEEWLRTGALTAGGAPDWHMRPGAQQARCTVPPCPGCQHFSALRGIAVFHCFSA